MKCMQKLDYAEIGLLYRGILTPDSCRGESLCELDLLKSVMFAEVV